MNTEHTQYFIQDKQPLEQDKQPPVGTVGSQVSSGKKSGCSTGQAPPSCPARGSVAVGIATPVLTPRQRRRRFPTPTQERAPDVKLHAIAPPVLP